MTAISDRLAELGVTIPTLPAPAGAYVPYAVSGNLVFTAGQLPFTDGALPATGKVGAEVSPEDAKGYARTAVLNALAAVRLLSARSTGSPGSSSSSASWPPTRRSAGSPVSSTAHRTCSARSSETSASTPARPSVSRFCRSTPRSRSSSSSSSRSVAGRVARQRVSRPGFDTALRAYSTHSSRYLSLSVMICITEVSASVVVSPISRPSATS